MPLCVSGWRKSTFFIAPQIWMDPQPMAQDGPGPAGHVTSCILCRSKTFTFPKFVPSAARPAPSSWASLGNAGTSPWEKWEKWQKTGKKTWKNHGIWINLAGRNGKCLEFANSTIPHHRNHHIFGGPPLTFWPKSESYPQIEGWKWSARPRQFDLPQVSLVDLPVPPNLRWTQGSTHRKTWASLPSLPSRNVETTSFSCGNLPILWLHGSMALPFQNVGTCARLPGDPRLL